MTARNLVVAFSALALAAASFTASADILFANLGTGAPPATVGGHVLTPFDQAAQASIADYTTGISVIPGSPVAGSLGISPTADKRTVGVSWWAGNTAAWGHGYTGPVFYVQARPVVLTLPANTQAFYFYVQQDQGGTFNVSATTNSGVTSGAVPVLSGPSGSANGFAFYSTAGETITSISISNDAPSFPGMAIAEFGISGAAQQTCASEGYTGTQLTWCRNICEMGYTGSTLSTWIRRWTDRYR
ncbi:MAG: hypothetical protein EOP93_04075, partial [Lysobacteraceae bacterium]